MQKRHEIQQKSRLGSLLLSKGLVTRQQLDEALTIQNEMNMRLGEVLIQKGWLTERQLSRALRKQSRYRLIAAMTAVLLGPIQPFLSSAHASEMSPSQNEQVFERAGMVQMSENELASISGQGAMSNYDRLLDIVNNDIKSDDDFAQSTLESLAGSLIPGVNLLEADIEVSGVQYEPGPRTTINTDGSLDIQLPTNIKQIAFRNVNVAGAEGAHMGDVIIRDLSFSAGTTVKIHVR